MARFWLFKEQTFFYPSLTVTVCIVLLNIRSCFYWLYSPQCMKLKHIVSSFFSPCALFQHVLLKVIIQKIQDALVQREVWSCTFFILRFNCPFIQTFLLKTWRITWRRHQANKKKETILKYKYKHTKQSVKKVIDR